MKGKVKRVISWGLLLATVFTVTALSASTSRNIWVDANLMTVEINGQKLEADNFLYNGTTYVPIRAAAEAMDGTVSFDAATHTAKIFKVNSNDTKTAMGITFNAMQCALTISSYSNLLVADYGKFNVSLDFIQQMADTLDAMKADQTDASIFINGIISIPVQNAAYNVFYAKNDLLNTFSEVLTDYLAKRINQTPPSDFWDASSRLIENISNVDTASSDLVKAC